MISFSILKYLLRAKYFLETEQTRLTQVAGGLRVRVRGEGGRGPHPAVPPPLLSSPGPPRLQPRAGPVLGRGRPATAPAAGLELQRLHGAVQQHLLVAQQYPGGVPRPQEDPRELGQGGADAAGAGEGRGEAGEIPQGVRPDGGQLPRAGGGGHLAPRPRHDQVGDAGPAPRPGRRHQPRHRRHRHLPGHRGGGAVPAAVAAGDGGQDRPAAVQQPRHLVSQGPRAQDGRVSGEL